ncbi:VanZ family protein [Paramicrobacterium fandaimingii]|uniref:VanZ family protein n=1 Tax=Paramicrobacterium fandaimingii TaxID=2708079 RepID=UPI0014232C16|nr:VanZ family protein [Microbacterium fandaimingii]
MLHRRAIFGAVSALYAVFIGAVTLTPDPFGTGVEGTIDRVIDAFSQHPLTAWMTYDVVEFTANIGMFVPLGLFVAVWAGPRRWWVGIVVGAAYTIVIESFQGILLAATRYATLSDVIANTLGAIIGAVLARLIHAFVVARAARSSEAGSVR